MPGSFKDLPTPLPLGGATSGEIYAYRMGTIRFRDPDSGVVKQVEQCLYVPEFPISCLQPTLLRQRGTIFHFENCTLTSADGHVVQVGRDDMCIRAEYLPELTPRAGVMTIAVEANAAAPVVGADSVVRGARGALHLDADEWTRKQRAEFELHYARLNEPGLERLANLDKVADGVAPILKKANGVNTASATRMLANPAKSPPVAGSTAPVAPSASAVLARWCSWTDAAVRSGILSAGLTS